MDSFSQPIRILQIFTILNRGGAETNVMNYYRKLDRTKFQFDFVVHRKEKGAYEDEIIALGGRIFRFPNIHPLFLKIYRKQIVSFFDEHCYTIIHGQCSELGYFFYKEAHRRNVPVIIAHAHNSKSHIDIKAPFRWFWKTKMLKYINAYFSCGDEASIWFFGRKIAKVAFVMTNAIDSSDFSFNEAKSSEVRVKLKSESTQNFVHIGRFNEQKNHEFLIDVFYELCKIRSNYKLFLIGEGELKSQIERKVEKLNLQNEIVFLGGRNDVNDLLQAMDCFIFPSLFEGLPVSLVEAQASGVKCYISDGIPIQAIIVPENVEVISLKKSARFWAEKIDSQKIFLKKELSDIFIKNGYDINENVKLLEEKYFELLNINR